jgi:hypothetical protein
MVISYQDIIYHAKDMRQKTLLTPQNLADMISKEEGKL